MYIFFSTLILIWNRMCTTRLGPKIHGWTNEENNPFQQKDKESYLFMGFNYSEINAFKQPHIFLWLTNRFYATPQSTPSYPLSSIVKLSCWRRMWHNNNFIVIRVISVFTYIFFSSVGVLIKDLQYLNKRIYVRICLELNSSHL